MKLSTTKVNAFGSPNSGPIGEVYDGKVEFYKTANRESISGAPFRVSIDEKLPKVEIVYMYADPSPEYLKLLIKQNVDGIIIAGVGNGNFSKAFTEAIKLAISNGIVVCRGSRCIMGRVVMNGEVDDEAMGTIVADDLNPQKARILLMLGLTKTKNIKELQSYFLKY